MRAPQAIDHFRLLRPLGEGSMGQVCLYEDALLHRQVAIKFLRAPAPDPALLARFRTESRAIARLSHPNIVTLFQYGVHRDRPYLVFEFIEGQSLKDLPRPIPPERVVAIGLDLARGLGAAHARGVLHRDIKPANAILSASGQVKLIDFGLAKLSRPELADDQLSDRAAEGAPSGADQTHPGRAPGTPGYMAPELWDGGLATPAADIYSLGVLLCELSTGRVPASASTRSGAPGRHPIDVPDLSGVRPPDLVPILARCLQRDPRQRFASADELAQALAQLLTCGEGDEALPAGNPYRGLYPFEAEHHASFFGRALELQDLLCRLRGATLTVLSGPSGAGKSSLCRAGLLPRLRAGALRDGRRYQALILRPGQRPLSELAAALADLLHLQQDELCRDLAAQPGRLARDLRLALGQDRGLCLFVDQAEELLTQSDPEEAAALGATLCQLDPDLPGVRVVLALREDHLLRLSESPGYEGLLRAVVPLRPPGPEALRQVIAEPARRSGFPFASSEMVAALAEASAGASGGLPLLQFALSTLWEARDPIRRVIPEEALARLGGVAGALSRHGDAVLDPLSPAEQAAARRLLTRLIHPDGTRARRAEADLLGGDPAEERALHALVEGRLLSTHRGRDGAAEYELAHEVLVRGWGRLRDWLTRDDERRALLGRLGEAAREWRRTGRATEGLWGERQVNEAATLSIEPAELPEGERDFLVRSQRRLRTRRRRRWALYGGAPLLLGLFVLFALSWRQDRDFRRLTEVLAQKEMGLRARALAAQPGQEVAALVAGLRGVLPDPRTAPTEAQAGLRAAVRLGRRALPLRGHGGAVRWTAFSPDGARLVSVSDDQTGRLWDARGGRLLAVLKTGASYVYYTAFSPGGDVVVLTGLGDHARVFDGRTGAARCVLAGDIQMSMSASFSPDGRLLVLGGGGGAAAPGLLEIWDLAACQRLRRIAVGERQHHGRALSVSPDGRMVAGDGPGHVVQLWDMADGEARLRLPGHKDGILLTRFSNDGRLLLSASADGSARLWDLAGGRQVWAFSGHEGPLWDAVWSPDESQVATAGRDGVVRLWDARSGAQRRVLLGHKGPVYKVDYSPDGGRLISVSADGAARLWDTRTGVALGVLLGHKGQIHHAAFSAGGERLSTAGGDHTVRLWHGGLGARLNVLRGHKEPLWRVRFSPDGRRLLTGAEDGARLWDGQSGAPVAVLGPRTEVMCAAFLPDGRVLIAGLDGSVRLWDGRSGAALREIEPPRRGMACVAASADGAWVATSTSAGLRIYEGAGLSLMAKQPLAPPAWIRTLAFSPDGLVLIALGQEHGRVHDARSGAPRGPAFAANAHGVILPMGLPDGATFLVNQADREAALRDLRTGALLRLLRGHTSEIWPVAASPDGRLVATGSTDRDWTARLWDPRTGAQVGPPLRHQHTVMGLCFSPDGGLLATASYDHRARLWDVRDGSLRAELRGHGAEVQAVDFSPDGGRLASGSIDNTARLWDVRRGGPLFADEGRDLLNPLLPEDDEIPETERRTEETGPPLQDVMRQACELLAEQPERAQVGAACPATSTSP